MSVLNRGDRGERPRRARSIQLLTGSLAILFACVGLANRALAQVTFDRLLNSGKEPQNWMTYSGD